jgi:starch-binding outer membrane protein, SusD/RagB family
MKIRYLISLLLGIISLESCNDFLDKQPLDKISTEAYYKNENQVNSALVGCYSRIMCGGWDGNLPSSINVFMTNVQLNCLADDAFCGWGLFLDITSGNISAANEATNKIYPSYYKSIAIYNSFISNMEDSKTDFMGESKKKLIAEVKFLRAYDYFFLTNLYGDLVLTLKPEDTDFNRGRDPKQKVIEAIINDLDYAIENLPNDAYIGRAVKGTAYALKMRVMLYNQNYSEVINIWNEYFATANNKFSISPSFYDIFKGANQNTNPEIMFSAHYIDDVRHFSDTDLTLTAYADVRVLPSFVDAFEFNDGSAFELTNPKYDATNVFNNRDPRLRMTVFDTVQVNTPGDFYYGKLAYGNAHNKILIKKFSKDDDLPTLESSTAADQDAVLIRYGDVALMFAEAENEMNGPSDKVINAVQLVRGRPDVNMPILPSNLSKEEMRTRIRNERRYELAFEGGFRFFDLMRWKEMGNIIPTITDPNGNTRAWHDYNYLWPLPTGALNNNKKLVQNPGYSAL